MFREIPNGSLIITRDNAKRDFLKKFRMTYGLKNVNIMGISEFKKKYYFDYTNETLLYVHKKFSVIKSIAKKYIENMYFIERDSDNEKVKFLYELKRELSNKGLLTTTPLFRESLKNRTIILYNLKNIDNFYENMFKDLELSTKVMRIDDEVQSNGPKTLYKFLDSSKELEFVATKIAELIKKGVPLNKIHITNVKDDYILKLRNIMRDFKIPINLDYSESIESTNLFAKVKATLENGLESTIEELTKEIHSAREESIVKSIIDTINEYSWCDDLSVIKDFLLEDISKIKIPSTKYKNAIIVEDFLEGNYDDEDYVFLINFNQGSFPITYKDEDYLNDETKLSLGMSDSVDLNKKIYTFAQEKILATKNLIVTYSIRSLKGELYISSIYDTSIFEYKEPFKTYVHSDDFNKKELVKEKDENRKYGTVSVNLSSLINHYRDFPYLCYDNKFKGIKKEKIMSYLDNKLTLSYSSMNTYYLCSFRYYLDNILKMNEFDETFDKTVGNIFHRVLSFAFEPDFNFDISWNRAIEESTYPFKTKDRFFLKLLEGELKLIIDGINSGMQYTSLKRSLYEQKIVINVDEVTSFKGFVDKILYDNFEDGQIAIIIDYKTGNPELKLDNVIYGIDMQLPIYAYLIRNFEPLKTAKIGGFYLQKILSSAIGAEEKLNSLKLQGYSNSDMSILKRIDNSYEESKIIKSMKISSNGLGAYAKVLSDTEIDKLIEIVETKIKEASIDIRNGKFEINPKLIGTKMYGCKFCKYKDICFMKNADIEKLKYVSKKDFLGGETDANLD